MTSLNRYRDESGTALVEFALVLPLVLVLILGIADFGRAFNYWIDSTHLANVAARYAAVNKNPGPPPGAPDCLTLQECMKERASTDELQSGVKVCIYPGATVGESVRVEVESTFSWLDYIVGRIDDFPTETKIVGKATMRLEAPPTNYSAGCA